MEIIKGTSVYPAIAIGRIKTLTRARPLIKRQAAADTDAELTRLDAALTKAKEQLIRLYEVALEKAGEENALIFEMHRMMLEDNGYLDSIRTIIKSQSLTAEYAVSVTEDNYADMFSAMDDTYMKERAADIRDISERVIDVLLGRENTGEVCQEPVIIMAEDLVPSETVQLDKDKVLAFVTRKGSTNSHTAILARTMGIPAIVSAEYDVDQEYSGALAVVDGFNGCMYLNPDQATLDEMADRIEEQQIKERLLQELKGKRSVTKSGKHINVYANIGSLDDLSAVILNDAEGIGLFRSEFLYLEKDSYPTEEEQFQVYKKTLETMGSRKVIIRTLDIGADKQITYFDLDQEENPALGYRAVRICLERPDIFKTQLRALYRAAVYGKLAIMIPMIISLHEIRRVKEAIADVKKELMSEGLPSGEAEFGIMIETPAAAVISDDLAKEVDFFSIGTNDLTQYTLAVDRQNQKLEPFYDTHHPAVLKMIEWVVESAHKNGIWAGICGELAADMELTEKFVEWGIDELSVSPAFILPIRKQIRECE